MLKLYDIDDDVQTCSTDEQSHGDGASSPALDIDSFVPIDHDQVDGLHGYDGRDPLYCRKVLSGSLCRDRGMVSRV